MNTENNSDIESSSYEDDHVLSMLPPIENAETDMDSHALDDMNDGPAHHLTRGLLNSTCESSLHDKGNKQKFVQHTQPQIRNQQNQLQETGKKALTYSQL